jgi:hypothetical protein
MDSDQFIRNNLSAHRVLEIKSNRTKYDDQLVLQFAVIERGYSVDQQILGPFVGVVVFKSGCGQIQLQLRILKDTIYMRHLVLN